MLLRTKLSRWYLPAGETFFLAMLIFNLYLTLISDTTATILTYIFYHLAILPKYQQEINTELQGISSLSNIAELQQLPILSSFIDETLRLFPPVPTSFARNSPPNGIMIEGVYIPPYTTLVTPRYSIGRCMC